MQARAEGAAALEAAIKVCVFGIELFFVLSLQVWCISSVGRSTQSPPPPKNTHVNANTTGAGREGGAARELAAGETGGRGGKVFHVLCVCVLFCVKVRRSSPSAPRQTPHADG